MIDTHERYAFGRALAMVVAALTLFWAGMTRAEPSVAPPAEEVAAKQDALLQRDLVPTQVAVQQVQTPAGSTGPGALQLRTWVDRDEQTYGSGEVVRVFAMTNKDAYVTILVVGASGQAAQIFPNQFQSQNFVRAHQAIEVLPLGMPARIQVSGQTGAELIKVIASTRPVALFSEGQLLAAAQSPFRMSRSGGADLARDLQVVMTQPVSAPAIPPSTGQHPLAAPALEWAVVNKVIKTVSGNQVALAAPPAYSTPAQPVYTAPAQPVYTAPAQPVYTAPVQPAYTAPVQPAYPAPAPLTYQAYQQAAIAYGTNGMRIATDRAVYRIGELVQVSVMSPSTCYLTVVDINPAGLGRILFPNQLQPNNLIQAGQTISLPGLMTELAIMAQAPGGQERIVASCNATQRDLPPATGTGVMTAGPFRLIADQTQVRDLIMAPAAPAVPAPGVASSGEIMAQATVTYIVSQ